MSHNEPRLSRSRGRGVGAVPITSTCQVISTDGVRLAVQCHGAPDAPVLVCVHGYPDDHHVWDLVRDRLLPNYRVVTYDVRGAGESETPRERAAYRLDQLADDLHAVLEVVSPDQPVHLLAHDWGSIQSWHAVTQDRFRDRISSYTSISGPCLDHAGHWLRARLAPHPTALRELGRQAVSSGYLGFFHLAPLPELAWRSGLGGHLVRLLERIGGASEAGGAPPHRPTSDLVAGLNLYRANLIAHLSRPADRHTTVPVQVLAPTGDVFVSPAVQTDIARWVPALRVRRVCGGHWLPRTHPDVVARHTAEFITDLTPSELRGEHESRRAPHRDS